LSARQRLVSSPVDGPGEEQHGLCFFWLHFWQLPALLGTPQQQEPDVGLLHETQDSSWFAGF
jgi:hypothetical protein